MEKLNEQLKKLNTNFKHPYLSVLYLREVEWK